MAEITSPQCVLSGLFILIAGTIEGEEGNHEKVAIFPAEGMTE